MAHDPAAEAAAALRASLGDVDLLRADLGAVLDQTIAGSRSMLRVTGAGLMLLDEQQDLRYVGASDEGGRALERAQLRHHIGPGLDAIAAGRTVSVPDITADGAYRELATDLRAAGVHAVLAQPVHLGGQRVGVLNLYRANPRAWTEEDEAGACAFADVLAVVLRSLVQSRRQDVLLRHLQRLLDPFRPDAEQ